MLSVVAAPRTHAVRRKAVSQVARGHLSPMAGFKVLLTIPGRRQIQAAQATAVSACELVVSTRCCQSPQMKADEAVTLGLYGTTVSPSTANTTGPLYRRPIEARTACCALSITDDRWLSSSLPA